MASFDYQNTLLRKFLNDSASHKRWNIIGPMPIKRPYLLKNAPTIFIDGGIIHKETNKDLFKDLPSISVGDGDSSSQDIDILVSTNKDYNDLTLAFEILDLSSKELQQIELYGLLEGRKDHEMINILESLNWLKRQVIKRQVSFEKEIICCSAGKWNFYHEGLFSLVLFEESVIELSGAIKYPCKKMRPLSSQGLSNQGFGDFSWQSNKATLFYFNETGIR